LRRFRALGVYVMGLYPVSPIGETARKGSLGSPYAIRDYRTVNPELGSMEDFAALVEAIHAQGMRCILDVVYNHTSPDSVLIEDHPEWFYHHADGSFGNRIGDWSDIVDLDYSQPGLWDYQIETLKQWARLVDGFRCDVAPLIPLPFWTKARAEVEEIRPGCLWLSESVEPSFIKENRERGMVCLSDSEIYQAFDLCYDYDVHGELLGYLLERRPLEHYAAALDRQESTYPDNYGKLRFLENHDRPRARFLIPDDHQRRNWTAFLFFQKGMTLLYNGQEVENTSRPSLFDRDPIDWETGRDITPFLQRLSHIKRNRILTDSAYKVWVENQGVLLAEHRARQGRALGVFCVQGQGATVKVHWPDGRYRNQIDDRTVIVEDGLLSCDGEPIILFIENAASSVTECR